MSNQHSSDAGFPEVPAAAVKTARRRFSLVWLVPVVAALIGGWLVVKALTEKGPVITITFKTADGLEAGKTKIKFKDVEIGVVEEVLLGKDLSHVVAKAQFVKEAESFLSENTRFWVVRARVSASAIQGLGTVFSGAYIDVDPGKKGKPATSFQGLEDPPIVTTGLPGRHFILESERKGSLEIGATIYYRQIRVGEVVAYNLSEDGTKIISKVFVNAPYHQFVRNNTRFWSASGVDLKLDATGVTLETESFVSIMVGGIAFDTIDANSGREAEAPENSTFNLFANHEAAKQKIYNERNYYALLFDESVRGLSPGAPVEFRGIPIGQVIDIKSEFDLKSNRAKIPVIVAAEPERIQFVGKLPDGVNRETLVDYLIEKGFRAQLRTGNLLTGQVYVAIDLFPGAKPAKLVRGGRYGYPEFPTTPTQFEAIGEKFNQLVAKLEKVPIDQIGNDLRETMQGAKRITNSPELLETVKSLNAAVKELQLLTTELRTRTAPEATAALQQAQRALVAAEGSLAADSPQQYRVKAALDEISGAARALRVLTEYLEAHPESLLRGKGSEK
ncbi:MAG TPA: MlaD family protein [Desulfobacterales bacterium]|nr:MlaD family protein [Desulfobacterales bacterium]